MRGSRRWSALSVAASLCGAWSCSSLRGTERVFNGRVVQGSYVAPEAYAAYAEGAYREARGEWAAAEVAYRAALRSDRHSPQIWTRLGVLACRESLSRALADFERALASEPHAPAWTERARCLLRHRLRVAALESALQAVRLEPRGADANLLVVRLYRESSRAELARDWLFAWLLLQPELGGSRTELLEQTQHLADAQLSELARTALTPPGRLVGAAPGSAPGAPPPPLRRALAEGNLERARELARDARIAPIELALLATRSARPELGLAQARLLLAANPQDPSALVVALLAAALLEDDRPFLGVLRGAESDGLPPAALARELASLLRSRVDDEAADSWQAAYSRVAPAPPEPSPSVPSR